jgi:hypothetical protein
MLLRMSKYLIQNVCFPEKVLSVYKGTVDRRLIFMKQIILSEILDIQHIANVNRD